MQRRLQWSLRAFKISLGILFLAGALSAGAWQYHRADLTGVCSAAIAIAAASAGAARCWQWCVQRAIRRADFSVGPGHYGLDGLCGR